MTHIKHKLTFGIGLIVSVMAACTVLAQNGQNVSPERKPLAAERLSMPLFPAGWIEVHRETAPVEVVEYVPQGQTAAAWQDKILLQVYHNLNNLPLDAIQRRMQGQNRNICTGVIEGPLQSGMNNGYASAFWTLGCRSIKGSRDETGQTGVIGETQYTKAIQGESALYVLSRLWRTPAFGGDGPAIPAAAINDGVAFLTTSVACVPNSSTHPCPNDR